MPIARFQGLVGQKTVLGAKIFVFITCWKQIFLGTAQFGEHCLRMPPRGYGPG